MRFEVDITLTDEDSYAFNIFHVLDSPNGKKQLRQHRIVYSIILLLTAVLYLLVVRSIDRAALYLLLIGTYLLLYLIFLRKIMTRRIQRQLKKLQKDGKQLYDPTAHMIFEAHTLTEITPNSRTEIGYERIEQVFVLEDRYLFLFYGGGAYILPIPQLRNQLDLYGFLTFLTEKCGKVEYC